MGRKNKYAVAAESQWFPTARSWIKGSCHVQERVGLKAAMLREAATLDAMQLPGGDELRTAISRLTERSFDRIRDAI